MPPFTSIRESSPVNGETGVAVIRETIVQFSASLASSSVVTTDNFYAGYGGQKLLSRVELSTDRRKATLFYLEPLPGSTHPYKYRLFCGQADGSCLVRYDSERCKEDHLHVGDNEETYSFSTLLKLIEDFEADIERM